LTSVFFPFSNTPHHPPLSCLVRFFRLKINPPSFGFQTSLRFSPFFDWIASKRPLFLSPLHPILVLKYCLFCLFASLSVHYFFSFRPHGTPLCTSMFPIALFPVFFLLLPKPTFEGITPHELVSLTLSLQVIVIGFPSFLDFTSPVVPSVKKVRRPVSILIVGLL